MQNVSLDRLRQVANLARSVASALDVDTVLRQVVEAVLSLRPRAFCVVRLVDLERGGYRLAAKGGADEDETDVESVAEVIPFGRGMTHAVAQSGQPVLLPDALGDPRLVSAMWHEERGLKVYYGVPISAGGELMGVLNVALSETAPPTAEERARPGAGPRRPSRRSGASCPRPSTWSRSASASPTWCCARCGCAPPCSTAFSPGRVIWR